MSDAMEWFFQHKIALSVELLVHLLAALWMLQKLKNTLLWIQKLFKKTPKSSNKRAKPTPIPSLWIFLGTTLTFVLVGGVFLIWIATRPPPDGQQVRSEKVEMRVKADLKKLVSELSIKVETKYSKITPAPQMISGNEGNYFYVDLLDPITKQTILFSAGEFKLNGANKNHLIQALRHFQSDVMNLAVQGGAKIFIQGKADILDEKFKKPYVETTCAGEPFSKIWHYPRSDKESNYFYQNKYDKKYLPTKIGSLYLSPFWSDLLERFGLPKEYGNTDLPELRSRYIQCQYKALFENVPTYLLQGKTTSAVDPNDRNATLILYIPKLE